MGKKWAEVRKNLNKKPASAECKVAFDPDAVDAYHLALATRDEAETRIESALSKEQPVPESDRTALAEAIEALEAAEEAMEGSIITFRFEALGKADYEALVDLHPPTKEQRAAKIKMGGFPPIFNSDTFPQALIAASIVDPEMDAAEVEELYKTPEWNQSEVNDLFIAAMDANSSRRIPDLGKGSGPTKS